MRQVGFSGEQGALAQEGFTHEKMRKPLWGRGSECLLQPVVCRGHPRAVPLPGEGLGKPWEVGDSLLLLVVFFSLGMLPSSSPASPLRVPPCSLCCTPWALLMCEPDPPLEERFWRWGLAEQPCDPPLHREHRPAGLLFFVSCWKAVQISAGSEARNGRWREGQSLDSG